MYKKKGLRSDAERPAQYAGPFLQSLLRLLQETVWTHHFLCRILFLAFGASDMRVCVAHFLRPPQFGQEPNRNSYTSEHAPQRPFPCAKVSSEDSFFVSFIQTPLHNTVQYTSQHKNLVPQCYHVLYAKF